MTRLFAGILLALPIAAAGRPCDWRSVEPGSGHFTVGAMALDLGEADDPMTPRAWLGPITVAHAGSAPCTVDSAVSIIDRPIFANGTVLLISTYSGSNGTVFGVDMQTCRVVWKSQPFSGGISLTGSQLALGKTVFNLGRSCLP